MFFFFNGCNWVVVGLITRAGVTILNFLQQNHPKFFFLSLPSFHFIEEIKTISSCHFSTVRYLQIIILPEGGQAW